MHGKKTIGTPVIRRASPFNRKGGNILSVKRRIGSKLAIAGCGIATVSLLYGSPVMAETTVSGQSDTILRMRTSFNNNNHYPLYEYLRLSATTGLQNGDSVSFQAGGWGRVELADRGFRNKDADIDLQYGYLSYRGAANNLQLNAGRQFVTEGVAAERIDGLYLRNDFAAGFGAAVFIGSQVVTEPNFQGDDLIFGGRITQGMSGYYTIGVSALKSFSDSARYREEEGVDIWVHPMKQVDLTGRSSYNSLTNGWMEHAYTLSLTPVEKLGITLDVSNINYRDYFYRVTTSAFSFSTPGAPNLLNPDEELLTLGGAITYSPLKNLTIGADYKNYEYDIAGTANYFGGRASYSVPDSFSVGFSVHRMDGSTDGLRYLESRIFASKRLTPLDLSLDLVNLNYDSRISGVRNAYTVAGAAAYTFNEMLKLTADLVYSRSAYLDNEVRGLLKLTFAFDTLAKRRP